MFRSNELLVIEKQVIDKSTTDEKVYEDDENDNNLGENKESQASERVSPDITTTPTKRLSKISVFRRT